MLWDGNRQAQECTDTYIFTTVYEQNSFAPVARLMWLKDGLTIAANDEVYSSKRDDDNNDIPKSGIQIYHYHNDHLGTPNELTDQQGEVVWLADYKAWGNTAKVVWYEQELEQLQVAKEDLQPLRFQGQYYDEETGLHYNRFRYFDFDLGMFTSRDPIGLMDGTNVFQYAPNPTGWIDPFGLSGIDASGRPLSSSHYSVWQQFELPVDVQPGSRSQHFRNANEQLYNTIQKSPFLSSQLPSDVVAHIQPGSRGGFKGTSPPG